MNISTKVANRISYLCIERGITINKLATLSGITQSTLDSILKGKSKNPSILTIKMVCDGLKISLRDFFDTSEFTQDEEE